MARGIRFDNGNSLVVFATTAKLVGDEKPYHSKLLQRMDFESQQLIAVQQ